MTETIPDLSFCVPGFSKCGTTTLCALLEQHPQLCLSEPKEPNFFRNREYEQHWGHYRECFRHARPGQQLGDGSTSYAAAFNEHFVREALRRHYPALKLIFIARDPLRRIESSFREFHHSGPDFGVMTPWRLQDALDALPAMINDTLFWSRFSAYAEWFPAEQLHVVFLEELQADTEAVLRGCFRFLGVDEDAPLQRPAQHLNRGSGKLRDTALMRRLRQGKRSGRWLGRYPVAVQDRYARPLGLRRPNRDTIDWTPALRQRLQEAFGDEIHTFLDANGRDHGLWPGWQALLG